MPICLRAMGFIESSTKCNSNSLDFFARWDKAAGLFVTEFNSLFSSGNGPFPQSRRQSASLRVRRKQLRLRAST